MALGALVLRPIGNGKAEYITADKMIPICFDDDGKPNDIAFLSVKTIGENDYYTRVERHYFTDGHLTIENKCYHSESLNDIGRMCSLQEVKEWEMLQPGPIIYKGMKQMDFGYYQNPIEIILTDQRAVYQFTNQQKVGSGKLIFKEQGLTGSMTPAKEQSMLIKGRCEVRTAKAICQN